jgi:hypothetical protein
MRALHRGARRSADIPERQVFSVSADASSSDSNFDLTGQIVEGPQLNQNNNGETIGMLNTQIIPEVLPSLSNLLDTQSTNVDINANANTNAFDLTLHRGWGGPVLDRLQPPSANVEPTTRPQALLQLLDESFDQWQWDEPFYTFPWSEDVTKILTARDGDPDNGEYQSSDLYLGLIPAEIEQAKLNLQLFDVENRLSDFVFPTSYMVIRLVRGFFKYFTPHCPITHAQTFSIGTIEGRGGLV